MEALLMAIERDDGASVFQILTQDTSLLHKYLVFYLLRNEKSRFCLNYNSIQPSLGSENIQFSF